MRTSILPVRHQNTARVPRRSGMGRVMVWIALPLTVVIAQVNFTSSNLPIVVIDTEGQTIPDEPKIRARMGIIWNPANARNLITDPFNNYDGAIGIEVRGSSSQYFYPKKQYGFETIDDAGENKDVSLLGLPAENDWILHAPYGDKTLIRNALIYQLSNEIGRYASRCRFCELVLNGEYAGLYILMEKIKRGKNRVAISKLEPQEISGDDLTGGYIVKIDKLEGSEIDGWYSPFLPYPGAHQHIYYQYHYPKASAIVTEQRQYIQGVVANFEELMNRPDYADPVTGYRTLIDLPSAVDFFLLNEFPKNVDAYRLSAFLYKDKDSDDPTLHFGPIWDFDLSYGNANYYNGWLTDGWQLDYFREAAEFRSDGFQVPFWWSKIAADPAFLDSAAARWQVLRQNQLSRTHIYAVMDSMTALIQEARVRNFQRWNEVIGYWVWPNYYVGATYLEEVNWMKQWIYHRLNWMDQTLAQYNRLHSTTGDAVCRDLRLERCYPNPFNNQLTINFTTTTTDGIKLTIYNLAGGPVDQIFYQPGAPGNHSLFWQPRHIASGVYWAVLTDGTLSRIQKVLFLK